MQDAYIFDQKFYGDKTLQFSSTNPPKDNQLFDYITFNSGSPNSEW